MPNKQELTNGIVNDIKSRLEKFKQHKKAESNSNSVNEFGNIDITKDLLEKFKKSNLRQIGSFNIPNFYNKFIKQKLIFLNIYQIKAQIQISQITTKKSLRLS